MRVGVVIPVGAGRDHNLIMALDALAAQTLQPHAVVVVADGPDAVAPGITFDQSSWAGRSLVVRAEKHEPGMEQPRNIGVRMLRNVFDVDHVWFVDSDVIVTPDALAALERAHDQAAEDRILVAPYEWLPAGVRHPVEELRNDFRWVSFDQYDPSEVLRNDLAAGLACFSGNLVWPVSEFERVGGFWNELHHGRCEDGELGLRAVAMDVGISFVREARGWHLDHPVNTDVVLARNTRDVPMLNERHPWVERGAVFMVDRDGKAFDTTCPKCTSSVPTILWWQHAAECGVIPPAIPVAPNGSLD